jgi:toxin CcdB
MARFDLHRLGGVLVVDLQHDLLDHLPTRVVAPLLPPDQAGQPVRDLHPIFEFDGGTHILALHQLAAVPRRELGPAIGTLDAGYDAIMRGLGILLLTGV